MNRFLILWILLDNKGIQIRKRQLIRKRKIKEKRKKKKKQSNNKKKINKMMLIKIKKKLLILYKVFNKELDLINHQKKEKVERKRNNF